MVQRKVILAQRLRGQESEAHKNRALHQAEAAQVLAEPEVVEADVCPDGRDLGPTLELGNAGGRTVAVNVRDGVGVEGKLAGGAFRDPKEFVIGIERRAAGLGQDARVRGTIKGGASRMRWRTRRGLRSRERERSMRTTVSTFL
jgi:hypothetical protein